MADNEEIKDIDNTCEDVADACEEVNQETMDTESEETSAKEEAPAKGKTSRKDKKEKKDKKDQKIEELNDRLMRLMAEYDNYRKRTEKEKSAMYETGVRSFIEKILPVLDNFERGFGCVEEGTEDAFTQGMKKIYDQFVSTMNEAGVTEIEAVGKEFDPNLHNAVMHIDDEEFGDNIVVEEFQKGYMYRDTVVRYSMVKVAN